MPGLDELLGLGRLGTRANYGMDGLSATEGLFGRDQGTEGPRDRGFGAFARERRKRRRLKLDDDAPEDFTEQLRKRVREMPAEDIEDAPHGALQWALETLDLPRNAIANVVNLAVGAKPTSKTRAFGLPKISGGDILRKVGLSASGTKGPRDRGTKGSTGGKVVDFLAGFLGDVALDPLTYLGGPAIARIGGKAFTRTGAKAVEKTAEGLTRTLARPTLGKGLETALGRGASHLHNPPATSLAADLGKQSWKETVREAAAKSAAEIPGAIDDSAVRVSTHGLREFHPLDLPAFLTAGAAGLAGGPKAVGAVRKVYEPLRKITKPILNPLSFVPEATGTLLSKGAAGKIAGGLGLPRIGRAISNLPGAAPIARGLGEVKRGLWKRFSTEPVPPRPGDEADLQRWQAQKLEQSIAGVTSRKQRGAALEQHKYFVEALETHAATELGIPAEILKPAVLHLRESLPALEKAKAQGLDQVRAGLAELALAEEIKPNVLKTAQAAIERHWPAFAGGKLSRAELLAKIEGPVASVRGTKGPRDQGTEGIAPDSLAAKIGHLIPETGENIAATVRELVLEHKGTPEQAEKLAAFVPMAREAADARKAAELERARGITLDQPQGFRGEHSGGLRQMAGLVLPRVPDNAPPEVLRGYLKSAFGSAAVQAQMKGKLGTVEGMNELQSVFTDLRKTGKGGSARGLGGPSSVKPGLPMSLIDAEGRSYPASVQLVDAFDLTSRARVKNARRKTPRIEANPNYPVELAGEAPGMNAGALKSVAHNPKFELLTDFTSDPSFGPPVTAVVEGREVVLRGTSIVEGMHAWTADQQAAWREHLKGKIGAFPEGLKLPVLVRRMETGEVPKRGTEGLRDQGTKVIDPLTAARNGLADYAKQRGFDASTPDDVLTADERYQKLQRAVEFEQRSRSAIEGVGTRGRNVDESKLGIEHAAAQILSLQAIRFAPVHTLPSEARELMQAEAARLIDKAETPAIRKALQKIIDGKGKDTGREVMLQKERIDGILSGELDDRSQIERDIGAPQRPVEERWLGYKEGAENALAERGPNAELGMRNAERNTEEGLPRSEFPVPSSPLPLKPEVAQFAEASASRAATAQSKARAALSALGHEDLADLPAIAWEGGPGRIAADDVGGFLRENPELKTWLGKNLTPQRKKELLGNPGELAERIEDLRTLTQEGNQATRQPGNQGELRVAHPVLEIIKHIERDEVKRLGRVGAYEGVPNPELSTQRGIGYMKRVLGDPKTRLGEMLRKGGMSIFSASQKAREILPDAYTAEANKLLDAQKAGVRFEMDPELSHISRELEAERTIGSAEFFKQAAARFGIRVDKGPPPAGFQKINVAGFGDEAREFAFRPEVAAVLEKHAAALIEPSKPLKLYRELLNTWKGWALLAPAYHANNKFGNVWNSMLLDGFSIKGEEHGRLLLRSLVTGKGMDLAIAGTGETRGSLYKKLFVQGAIGTGFYGQELRGSPEQVRELLDQMRNPPGMKLALKKLFGGKVTEANRTLGQIGEDTSKAGFVITRMRAGDGFDEAAAKMEKALFNYSDLTPFEKGTPERPGIRDVIPFYSWTKFNARLLMRVALTRPEKLALIPKLQMGLERELAGDETLPPSLRPAHVAETAGIQLSGGAQPKFLPIGRMLPVGELGLMNPFAPRQAVNRVINMIGGPAKSAVELALNKDTYFDRPITEYPGQRKEFLGMNVPSVAKYLGRQFRPANEVEQAMKLAGAAASGGGAAAGVAAQAAGLKTFPVDVGRQVFEQEKIVNTQMGAISRDAKRRIADVVRAGGVVREDAEANRLIKMYNDLKTQKEELPFREARKAFSASSDDRKQRFQQRLDEVLAGG